MSVTVYGVSPTREGDAGLRSSWMRRIVEVALDEDLGRGLVVMSPRWPLCRRKRRQQLTW